MQNAYVVKVIPSRFLFESNLLDCLQYHLMKSRAEKGKFIFLCREIQFSAQRNPSTNIHTDFSFIEQVIANTMRIANDCCYQKRLYNFKTVMDLLWQKKLLDIIGWLNDNLTHSINLTPIILMSIQCGYHSWISIHHSIPHNSQTKITNANTLGSLHEIYNFLALMFLQN